MIVFATVNVMFAFILKRKKKTKIVDFIFSAVFGGFGMALTVSMLTKLDSMENVGEDFGPLDFSALNTANRKVFSYNSITACSNIGSKLLLFVSKVHYREGRIMFGLLYKEVIVHKKRLIMISPVIIFFTGWCIVPSITTPDLNE